VTALIDGVVVVRRQPLAASIPEARYRAARLESEGYPTQQADPCIQSDSRRLSLSQASDTKNPTHRIHSAAPACPIWGGN
jgi:hypothetical protein